MEPSDYAIIEFMKVLAKKVNGFADLTKQQQIHLAWLLYTMPTNKGRQHNSPLKADYFSLSYTELDPIYGRSNFPKICKVLDILESTHWVYKENQTRGYRLTPSMRVIYNDYFNGISLTGSRSDIICLNNNIRRKALPAIRKLDINDKPIKAWRHILLPNPIKINILNIHKILDYWPSTPNAGTILSTLSECQLQNWKRWLQTITGLCNLKITSEDNLMQTYIEYDSGRIYGQHPHFLSCPRDIRHAAFTGFYEYDINNCHYAIFAQMAKKAGCATPTVDTYNQNKKTFRANLSHDLDLSIDDVKTVLLSKIYGASDSDKPSTAIPKLIGTTKAKELYQHEMYKSLSKEIKDGRKVILDDNEPNRAGYITNATGKKIHQDNTALSILSHLITGIEVIAIQAVLVNCTSILMVIHDGFIAELPMDVNTMEKQIYASTQYRLSMSGERIKTPAIFNELFENDRSL